MDEILKLQSLVLKLKDIKRKGWTLRGIEDCESVADHSYSTSFLVMLVAEKLKLDVEKSIKLALVHDLVEAKTTDITPHDMSEQEKKAIEKKAIEEIKAETNLINDLLDEYFENKTKEAKLVHDLDKIEMIIQAKNYQEKYPDKNLSEFFEYVKDKLELEESREFFEHLTE